MVQINFILFFKFFGSFLFWETITFPALPLLGHEQPNLYIFVHSCVCAGFFRISLFGIKFGFRHTIMASLTPQKLVASKC